MATHLTATTEFITANGIKYAYRRFGANAGTPVLFLIHFRGTMDNWDPAVVDGVAKTRPVILFDNAGTGKSSGQPANTVRGMADHVAAFINALGLPRVDIIGFSLGGYIAEIVALNHPEVVGKLILAGTAPSAGPQILPLTDEVARNATSPITADTFQELFFPKSKAGQLAARNFWARTHERKGTDSDPRAEYVEGDTMMAQVNAIVRWGTENPEGFDPKEGSFDRLEEIKAPTLIVQGHTDVMVPTIGSYIMQQRIPNAQLIIYPDSGHGSLFQYADNFVKQVAIFLDEA